MNDRCRIRWADQRSALRVVVITLVLAIATLPVTFSAGYPVSGAFGAVGSICGAISGLTAAFARSLDAYFIAAGVVLMLLSAMLIR